MIKSSIASGAHRKGPAVGGEGEIAGGRLLQAATEAEGPGIGRDLRFTWIIRRPTIQNVSCLDIMAPPLKMQAVRWDLGRVASDQA
jgi:hypothetical protein